MNSKLILKYLSLLASLFVSLACKANSDPWWQNGVVYEIFVRSFQDSNSDGKGDLNGIISRLDYLQHLGIKGIWLTPIYPSPSYHGYDVVDFKNVNSEFGDLQTLHRLLDEAHSRGIRLILDIPVNHTSANNSWFLNSSANSSAADRNLYIWSPQPLKWSAVNEPLKHWNLLNNEYYFSSFSPNMPDLNWKNPEVLNRITDVFKFWTQFGVDGFRLDAAQFLGKGPNGENNTDDTHRLWKSITKSCRELNPQIYFVGEVWNDSDKIAKYYGHGDELTASFDFPLESKLVSAIANSNPQNFIDGLNEHLKIQKNPFFAAPFLTNHDQVRFATLVNGDSNKLKLGAAILMSLPGTPYLYYGEEIGVGNGSGPDFSFDLGKRTPMPWESSTTGHGFTGAVKSWVPFSNSDPGISVQSQLDDPNSLLNTYRQLIQLRSTHEALSKGLVSWQAINADGVVAFLRETPQEKVLIIANFTSSLKIQTAITGIPNLPHRENYEVLFGEAGSVNEVSDTIQIKNLARSSVLILKL
ncbi:MAG: alpha-amylase family glycosyl hydrolase [Pseudobdellovibrionaceae bacterium]